MCTCHEHGEVITKMCILSLKCGFENNSINFALIIRSSRINTKELESVMAKKEVKTDLWVYELLNEADIHLTPQGCDILEINEALKTASKSGTGNVGYPEYCGVVKDFIIVIEDKAALDLGDTNAVIENLTLPTIGAILVPTLALII